LKTQADSQIVRLTNSPPQHNEEVIFSID
jgi:hypothetical protein